MRDWVRSLDTTHYVIGSVVGPHPYPQMVRDFQSVIGRETKKQIVEKEGDSRLCFSLWGRKQCYGNVL